MKILIRSTLVVTCLFVLALAIGVLGTNPAAVAGGEPDSAALSLSPTPPGIELPAALQPEDPIELAGCTASTTCSDGSMLSCSGGFGETCQESSESCTVLDCSGSRNFVQCGATKKVCPCDIGGCEPCVNPTGCNAGMRCTTHEQCGTCGGCVNRVCICISAI